MNSLTDVMKKLKGHGVEITEFNGWMLHTSIGLWTMSPGKTKLDGVSVSKKEFDDVVHKKLKDLNIT